MSAAARLLAAAILASSAGQAIAAGDWSDAFLKPLTAPQAAPAAAPPCPRNVVTGAPHPDCPPEGMSQEERDFIESLRWRIKSEACRVERDVEAPAWCYQ